jgi:uncharacterized protein (TIGR02266 family)
MSGALAEFVLQHAESAAPLMRARRACPRVVLDAAVTLESDHNFYTGLACNISEGGLFVATYQHHPVGTQLTVRFTLPGRERAIETPVEVCWIRDARSSTLPTGMGLRFLDLGGADLLAVTDFVQQRDTIFFED